MIANLTDEQEIIWLHPPARYAYLREKVGVFNTRRTFPKKERPDGVKTSDGGPGTHLVAYAVFKPGRPWDRGFFYRRYWWVKSYDDFAGHGHEKGFCYCGGNCPSEAVIPESIVAGKESVRGCRGERPSSEDQA